MIKLIIKYQNGESEEFERESFAHFYISGCLGKLTIYTGKMKEKCQEIERGEVIDLKQVKELLFKQV